MLEFHARASNSKKLTELFDYFIERWLKHEEIPSNVMLLPEATSHNKMILKFVTNE